MALVHVSCQSEGVNSRSLRLGWRCHRGQSCQSPHLFWRKTQNQTNPRVGWQRKAVRQVEQKFIHEGRALLRSQRGPLASSPLTANPTSRMTRMEAQPFRILLCRRLRFPLPLSFAPADVAANLILLAIIARRGHVAGVLGRRGMLWNALLCREARARVTTNMFVRDMDLGHFNALDARRLEVVADGLTLWRGAQLAIDTTLVSPLRRDGSARNNWMRLASARRGPTLNSVAKEVGPDWLCWKRGWGSMERGDCSVHHRVGERAG